MSSSSSSSTCTLASSSSSSSSSSLTTMRSLFDYADLLEAIAHANATTDRPFMGPSYPSTIFGPIKQPEEKQPSSSSSASTSDIPERVMGQVVDKFQTSLDRKACLLKYCQLMAKGEDPSRDSSDELLQLIHETKQDLEKEQKDGSSSIRDETCKQLDETYQLIRSVQNNESKDKIYQQLLNVISKSSNLVHEAASSHPETFRLPPEYLPILQSVLQKVELITLPKYNEHGERDQMISTLQTLIRACPS